MNERIAITSLILLLSISSIFCQDYYWYKDKQIKLRVDSTKLNVTLAKKQSESELNLLANLEKYSAKLTRNNSEETDSYEMFSIELESDKMYNEIVTLLKSNSSVSVVSPYFVRSEKNSIGTSSFFYVKLRDTNDYEKLKQFAEKVNVNIVKQVPYMPEWYILTTTEAKINSVEASNIAYESGLFADVDPAFMFNFKPNCTNDPDFSRLWGLNNNTYPGIDINICDAWNYAKGNGTKVAVVDQGIDFTHNDLKANFHPLSFDAESGTSPSVFVGWMHGTHVAGTIAAIKDNNLQVAGVAPESKIMGVSHNLHPTTTLSVELASGISWAWQNGADVINNSWGDWGGGWYNTLHSITLENSIANAMTRGRNGKGCVVVFAAGNRSPTMDYPGNSNEGIITVGAIQSDGSRWPTSAYGQALDVVAPGASVLSTALYNSVAYESGTSMAVPHVSGIAALILSVNPELTRKQVADIIESTAQKVGGYNYVSNSGRSNGTWNNEMGYGLVNAYEAVKMAKNYCIETTVNWPINQNETIKCDTINVINSTVKTGKKLILNAKKEVNINAGFEIQAGAELEINITP